MKPLHEFALLVAVIGFAVALAVWRPALGRRCSE